MGEAERGASMGEADDLALNTAHGSCFGDKPMEVSSWSLEEMEDIPTCLELGKGGEKASDSVDICIKATRYSLKRFLEEGKRTTLQSVRTTLHTIRKPKGKSGKSKLSNTVEGRGVSVMASLCDIPQSMDLSWSDPFYG